MWRKSAEDSPLENRMLEGFDFEECSIAADCIEGYRLWPKDLKAAFLLADYTSYFLRLVRSGSMLDKLSGHRSDWGT